jgi:anaerobic selenocysteine-containing dehydrogenase
VAKLIERMRANQVKALLVHGANPVYDLPTQVGFTEALKNVPLVVSFAPIVDETALWADLVLPDRTYLESWGFEQTSPGFDNVTLSSQQPVVEPIYDTRSAADVILTVAKAVPGASQMLPWTDEVAYLKDVVGSLPPGDLDGTSSEVRWARFQQHGGWWTSVEEAPPSPVRLPAKEPALAPVQLDGDQKEYPYFLHIIMSDLLSDGRGANQTWLQGSPDVNTSISWQTWVELNPMTAKGLELEQGDIVRVTSPYGEMEAPVYIYPALRPDTVAIPLGQGHSDYGRYARNRGSNPIDLVGMQDPQTARSLPWANQRVKITPTGRNASLATFESSVGVGQGFINKADPAG